MARTDLTPQDIVRTGLEEVLVAANADGNAFTNNGRTFLHVKNAAVADITVTIDTPNTVDGLAVGQLAVVVTAAEERLIGPFPPNIYNQSTGKVHVDYSAVVTVTVSVLRL